MAFVRPEKELYGYYYEKPDGSIAKQPGVLDDPRANLAMYNKVKGAGTGLVSLDTRTAKAGLGVGGTHVVRWSTPGSDNDDDDDDDGGGGGGGGGWGGYNYAPLIQSTKASAAQNVPLIFKQYNDAIGDQIQNNQAFHDLGDQAIAQARDLYEKQNANQRGIVDDMWYYQTQKFQNSRMQHEDAINNQYGSIWQRLNDLYNFMDDQMDQTNMNNLKQGLFQNGVEFQTSQNTTATNLAENDLQTYSQIRDILRQGGAALTNYANEILGQLSSYGDKEYRDANGNITPAGWEYLAQFGIENDGNGGFTFNYNKFSPNVDGTWGGANQTMDEYMSSLRDSRPTLWTVDYLPMIRDMMFNRTNVDYLQKQASRNRDEAGKNGKMSAFDYTEYNQRRYG